MQECSRKMSRRSSSEVSKTTRFLSMKPNPLKPATTIPFNFNAMEPRGTLSLGLVPSFLLISRILSHHCLDITSKVVQVKGHLAQKNLKSRGGSLHCLVELNACPGASVSVSVTGHHQTTTESAKLRTIIKQVLRLNWKWCFETAVKLWPDSKNTDHIQLSFSA